MAQGKGGAVVSQPKRYLCAFGMEGVMHPFDKGDWVTYADYAALQAEVAVLTAKVDWLMKADRLVVWNGTEWEIRHVQNK